MIAKRIAVPGNRQGRSQGFFRLSHYVSQEHKSDLSLLSPLLHSVETAGLEMQVTASLNDRVQKAPYHLAVSWGPKDHPTRDQVEATVHALLDDLGFDQKRHEWLAVVHRDALHYHLHIVVNRVDALSYRVRETPFDYYALNGTCRRLEKWFGWTRVPGINERRAELRGTDQGELEPAQIRERVKRGSVWSGKPCFQEWIGYTVGERAYRYLQRPQASWAGFTQLLAQYGLVYCPDKRGAVILDPQSPKYRARAGHLGRFATLPSLERRLGPYQHTPCELHPAGSYHQTIAQRPPEFTGGPLFETYRIEVLGNIESDRKRRSAAWHAQYASENDRKRALKAASRDRHRRAVDGPWRKKRFLHRVERALYQRQMRELQQQVAAERFDLRAKLGKTLSPPGFKSWLSAEAIRKNVQAGLQIARDRWKRWMRRKTFEIYPAVNQYRGAVQAEKHAVEYQPGRWATLIQEEVLVAPYRRICPDDPHYLTVDGIRDTSVLELLGSVYAVPQRDGTTTAIFRSVEPIDDPDQIIRRLRDIGAGDARVGAVPYPGSGAKPATGGGRQINLERELMTLYAKRTLNRPSRWIEAGETLFGIVKPSLGAGTLALLVRGQIVLAKGNLLAAPGTHVSVALDERGHLTVQALRPTIERESTESTESRTIDRSRPPFEMGM
jgi:relaxase-like protein